MSRRIQLIFLNLIVASALLAVLTNDRSVLQGDAIIYLERLEPILEGAIPYLETSFEHLPLSLVPLMLAAAIDAVPGISFTVALALVNGGLLTAVLWLAARIGAATNQPSLPGRWLLVAGPLFPIVLFRLDPFALVLSAAALLALIKGRRVATGVAGLAGMAARGWPVVFAIEEWREGWRAIALGTVAAAGLLASVLLATPGFSDARAFDGVQIETVVGSLLLVAGHVGGEPAALAETAGSLYVGTGAGPAIANALIGLGLIGFVAIKLGRFPARMTMLALAVYGLLLVSPLLSAQMLLWPTLFVAALRIAPMRLIAATGAITTLLLTLWQPDGAWWAALVLFRNLLLVATPLIIAAGVWGADQLSISRKNLPV